MKTIGIVYAISRLAGEHCKNLIEHHSKGLRTITHECPAAEYKAASNDIQKISQLIQRSIADLQKRGADIIIIAANSVHRAFDIVCTHTTYMYPQVRLISIVDVATAEVEKSKYRTVAIFGSNSTLDSEIYQRKLHAKGITTIPLSKSEQDFIHSLISSGISPDTVTVSMKERVIKIADRLKKSGCQAIILACTELPLIFNSENLKISVIDTSVVLALSAINAVNHLHTFHREEAGSAPSPLRARL